MRSCNIKLTTIDDVKNLVNSVSRFPFESELVSGRYVIDARSLMGIFSLDLSKPVQLNIHTDDADDFLKDIEHLLV